MKLDEDLASQMKGKKDVEMETEDLREKLDMFWLKVEEWKARIESERAALLDKSMSLDKELTMEMEEFASIRERMAALRKKNKAFHSIMTDKHQKWGKKTPSTSKGPVVVPTMLTSKQLRKTTMRKLATYLHSLVV